MSKLACSQQTFLMGVGSLKSLKNHHLVCPPYRASSTHRKWKTEPLWILHDLYLKPSAPIQGVQHGEHGIQCSLPKRSHATPRRPLPQMSIELQVASDRKLGASLSSWSCSLHGFHNIIACYGLLQMLTHSSPQACDCVLAHIWTAVQSENCWAAGQQWARKNIQPVKCSFCCSSLLFLPSVRSPFFLFLLFFLAHAFPNV